MAAISVSAAAAAQQFDASPTGGAIDGTVECGVASLDVTFNVPSAIQIGDLNLGFQAEHSWRTDINLSLTSPAGTEVDLLVGTFGANLDDYDVLFDDDTSGPVVDTGSHASADDTSAPFYDSVVRSEGDPLSDFDGENAAGTWTLSMCDVFPTEDDGSFDRATLFITPPSPDLELSIAASTTTPTYGSQVDLTVTVENVAGIEATGVTAAVSLPTGLAYSSDTAGTAFDPGTGTWTIGAIASGSIASFVITANVLVDDGQTVSAEVSAMVETDLDSVPGNASTNPAEDDSDTLTLSPQVAPGGTAGTPPVLTCTNPLRTLVLNDTGWSPGDLSSTGTQNGDDYSITVVDPTGDLLTRNVGGTPVQTPFLRSDASYGESPAPTTLYLRSNFETTAEEITTTFTLGTPGSGVERVQFKVYDLDTGGSGTEWVDRLTVTASLSGANVPVELTQGVSNVVAFNTIYATDNEGDSSSDATLYISALSPIDTVTVVWGSGPGAQSDPDIQAIAFSDLTYCAREGSAVLTASKTVDMATPGEFAIPGNDVIYTITVANAGDGPVDNNRVELIDPLPAEVIFYNGDLDGTGGLTSNPVAWSETGSGLSFVYADDVGYASSADPVPQDFGDCTYVPAIGYDPLVSHICFNPSGTMLAGDPDPEFSVSFRAQIR